MKNKLIQKSNVKQTRLHSLPILVPQQSLKSDIPFTLIPHNLITLQISQINHKFMKASNYKNNNESSFQYQGKNSRSIPYGQSQQLLLQKLILSNIEIQRLSNEVRKNQELINKSRDPIQFSLSQVNRNFNLQQLTKIQKENKQLKQKYNELIAKQQKREKPYIQLNQKHVNQQNQFKKKSSIKLNVPLSSSPIKNNSVSIQEFNKLKNHNQNLIIELNNKNNEINSVQTQLNSIKQEVFRLKAIQNQKKRLIGLQNNQVNTIVTQQINFERVKYSQDTKFKNNNDQISKLKTQIEFLKNQLKQREFLKIDNDNLVRQIQVLKQNIVLYTNQCHRLANQLLNKNSLIEKEKKQFFLNNEAIINQKIKNYREQAERLEKQNKILQKTINQLNYELNIQKNQNNQSIKSRIDWKSSSRSKNQTNQQNFTYNNDKIKYDILYQDYEKLKKSKQIEINLLTDQIQKLREQLNYEQLEKYNRQKSIQNSGIKLSKYFNIEESIHHEQNQSADNSILKKHLELSVKQMKQLYEISKITNEQLMKKVEQYHQQKNDISKKLQHQKFEVTKLYEVLQARRQELQICYKTIQNLKKGNLSPNIKKEDINQILKERRQQQLF